MDEKSQTSENISVRLEPVRDNAVDVYHIGRFDGYHEAILDVMPVFAAIGITCVAVLLIRHWE